MRITVDVLGPLASGMSEKEILNDFFIPLRSLAIKIAHAAKFKRRKITWCNALLLLA